MALSTEVVYEGYGNTIGLRLQVDGADLNDHRAITRAILEFGKGDTVLSPAAHLSIDSNTDPSYFDFTDPTKLILQLGAAGVPKGRHNVSLTVFLAAYPTGLSFGPALDIRAK